MFKHSGLTILNLEYSISERIRFHRRKEGPCLKQESVKMKTYVQFLLLQQTFLTLGKYPNHSVPQCTAGKSGNTDAYFFCLGSLDLNVFGNRVVPDDVWLAFAGIRPRSPLEAPGTTRSRSGQCAIKRVKTFNTAFLNTFP